MLGLQFISLLRLSLPSLHCHHHLQRHPTKPISTKLKSPHGLIFRPSIGSNKKALTHRQIRATSAAFQRWRVTHGDQSSGIWDGELLRVGQQNLLLVNTCESCWVTGNVKDWRYVLWHRQAARKRSPSFCKGEKSLKWSHQSAHHPQNSKNFKICPTSTRNYRSKIPLSTLRLYNLDSHLPMLYLYHTKDLCGTAIWLHTGPELIQMLYGIRVGL